MPYLLYSGKRVSPISDLDDYWQDEWGSIYDARNALYEGRKQDPKTAPRFGESFNSLDTLPALLPTPCWFCTDEFKELVERFEPGRHAFLPYIIRDKKDHSKTVSYNLINICDPIISIDIERSGPDVITEFDRIRANGCRTIVLKILNLTLGKGDVFLKKDRILDRHFWMDSQLNTSGQLFISDEFHREMIKLCDPKYLSILKTQ